MLYSSPIKVLRNIQAFENSAYSLYDIYESIRKQLVENLLVQMNDDTKTFETKAMTSLTMPLNGKEGVDKFVADYFNEKVTAIKPVEKIRQKASVKRKADLKFAILGDMIPLIVDKNNKNEFLQKMQRLEEGSDDFRWDVDPEDVDVMDTPTSMLKAKLSVIPSGTKANTFLPLKTTISLIRNIFAEVDMSYLMGQTEEIKLIHHFSNTVKDRLEELVSRKEYENLAALIEEMQSYIRDNNKKTFDILRYGYNQYALFKLDNAFLDAFEKYAGVPFSKEEAMKDEYFEKHRAFFDKHINKDNFFVTSKNSQYKFNFLFKTDIEDYNFEATIKYIKEKIDPTITWYLKKSEMMDMAIAIHNIIGSGRKTAFVENVEQQEWKSNGNSFTMHVNVKKDDWSKEDIRDNITDTMLTISDNGVVVFPQLDRIVALLRGRNIKSVPKDEKTTEGTREFNTREEITDLFNSFLNKVVSNKKLNINTNWVHLANDTKFDTIKNWYISNKKMSIDYTIEEKFNKEYSGQLDRFVEIEVNKKGADIDKNPNLTKEEKDIEKKALLEFSKTNKFKEYVMAKKIKDRASFAIYMKNNAAVLNDELEERYKEIAKVITDLAIISKNKLSSDNYTNPEGKKIFSFVQGSFLHDVLTYLKHDLKMEFMETDFYKMNPFISRKEIDGGYMRVLNFFYYGGWKTKDEDSSNTYSKETAHDFLRRNIVYNFVVSIMYPQNRERVISYLQPLYTLSDRTNMPHVEVPLISEEQDFRDNIRLMLDQKIFRMQNNLTHLKNYGKESWFNIDLFKDNESIMTKEKMEFMKAFEELSNAKTEEQKNSAQKRLDDAKSAIIDKVFTYIKEYYTPLLIRNFFEEEVVLPSDMDKLHGSIFLFSNEERKMLKEGGKKFLKGKNTGEQSDLEEGEASKKALEGLLNKIIPVMLFNNYINGFFLNQAFGGDFAAFKNVDDIVKRYQGASASGIAPLVRGIEYSEEENGNVVTRDRTTGKGMKKSFRVLLAEDVSAAGLSKKEWNKEYILERQRIYLDNKGLSETQIKEALALTQAELNTEEGYERLLNRYTPSVHSFLMKTFKEAGLEGKALEDKVSSVMTYFSAKGYDITDAQAFATPAFLEEIRKGFDSAFGLGRVLKFVYNAIVPTQNRKDASPIYLKNSIVILDDEIVARFPELNNLRKTLEYNKADVLSLGTGTKTSFLAKGAPNFNELVVSQGTKTDFTGSNAIWDLPSRFLRMQQNPFTYLDKKIALPSQILYFIATNNNGKDTVKQKVSDTYNAMTLLFNRLFKETYKSTIQDWTNTNVDKLRAEMIAYFSRQERGEDILKMLKAGTPLSALPLMNELAKSMSSDFTKNVLRFKFKGSKLTLQTQQGVVVYRDFEGNIIDKPLEMRTMIIEGKTVLMSDALISYNTLDEEQKAYFKEHGRLELFMNGDFMAFRIPSTGINSGLLINVVGFLDETLGSNQIIVAKEVVALHGSDFDVDSLFFIRRETLSKDDIRVMGIDNKEGFAKYTRYAGYTIVNGVHQLDFKNFLKLVEKEEKKIETELIEKEKQLKEINNAKEHEREIKKLKVDIEDLKKGRSGYNRIYIATLKNVMIDGMMSVLADESNRTRMAQALSMEMIKGERETTESNKYKKNAIYYFLKELGHNLSMNLNLSMPLDLFEMQKSVFDGNDGTGIFANGAKAVSYNNNAGSNKVVHTIGEINTEEKRVKMFNFLTSLKEEEDRIYTDEEAITIIAKTVIIANRIKNIKLSKFELSKRLNENDPSVMDIKNLIIELLHLRKKDLSIRQKPRIAEKAQFTLDGKLFNQLPDNEMTHLESNKISVWEVWEALINLSIDNTREKELSIMNANKHTFKFFVGATTLGIDLHVQVIIAKQPIIILFRQRRFNKSSAEKNLQSIGNALLNLYERKVNKKATLNARLYDDKDLHLIVKETENILNILEYKYNSGYEQFLKTNVLQNDTLIYYLNNNKPIETKNTPTWKLLEEAISGNTTAYEQIDIEYLKAQMATFVLFYKINMIGSHFSNSSKSIDVIKAQNMSITDILQTEEDIISNGITITDKENTNIMNYNDMEQSQVNNIRYTLFELSNNPLSVGNFAKINPHITTATAYFFALKERMQALKLLSKQSLDNIKQMMKRTNIKFSYKKHENTSAYIREYGAILQGLVLELDLSNFKYNHKPKYGGYKLYYGWEGKEMEIKAMMAAVKKYILTTNSPARFAMELLDVRKMAIYAEEFNDTLTDQLTTGFQELMYYKYENGEVTATTKPNYEILNNLFAYTVLSDGLTNSPRKIFTYLPPSIKIDFFARFDKAIDILNGEETNEKKVLLDKITFILLRRNGDKLYSLKKDGDIGKEGKYQMVVTEGKERTYEGKEMENYAGEAVLKGKMLYYDLQMNISNVSENTLEFLNGQNNQEELEDIEEAEEIKSSIIKQTFKYKQRIYHLLDYKINNGEINLYYATMGITDKYAKYTTDVNEQYINAVGKVKKVVQLGRYSFTHDINKEDTFIIVNKADKYIQQPSVIYKGYMYENTAEDKNADQALKLELLRIDNQLVVKEKKY